MSLTRNGILLATAITGLTSTFAQNSMQLSSTSIVDGKIRQEHACRSNGGKDVSVQLSVKDIPSEAKYLTIVMDDPDAVPVAGKTWVHWNLFNVPVSGDLNIRAGVPPEGDKGRATGGSKGYEGMCPPNGIHTYRFAVFATKEKIEVGGFIGPTAMTIESFETKFAPSVVSKARILGKF